MHPISLFHSIRLGGCPVLCPQQSEAAKPSNFREKLLVVNQRDEAPAAESEQKPTGKDFKPLIEEL